MALAIQRYLIVCHSQPAKRLCTQANTYAAILVIYLAATVSHLCRFVESTYIPVVLTSLTARDNVTTLLDGGNTPSDIVVVGCYKQYVPIVRRHKYVYFNVYYWSRVVIVHLVPCLTLICINSLLVRAMRAAQRRRAQLLAQKVQHGECRRLREHNLTTLMLTVVVGLFLLVEFPLAVLSILMIVENTFHLVLLGPVVRRQGSLLVNVCIMLSYPINFFIYCGMSRKFRDTFREIFCGGADGGGGGRLQADAESRMSRAAASAV